MDDVIVVGAGPAGLAIAAALGAAGLQVTGLSARPPDAPWPATYGAWVDELDGLELEHTLGWRWALTTAYAHSQPGLQPPGSFPAGSNMPPNAAPLAGAAYATQPAGSRLLLGREYALFDNARLQQHLLARCQAGNVAWCEGRAAACETHDGLSTITTRRGRRYPARLVIDASGHYPALLERPAGPPPAYQAAYGIVGRFNRPPVAPGELVLMDWRADHLDPDERRGPPTFLYAMGLGDERYFVEETSLALAPAFPLPRLERRLQQRLAARGIAATQIEHVERVLFPMNAPLPGRSGPLLGFGAAAGMVHPASGYQVAAALRRAPRLAAAVSAALARPDANPLSAARAGWTALWPAGRLRRRALYLFGLHTLIGFDAPTLQQFFAAFFRLPQPQWAGYLSDTLDLPGLLSTMLAVFRVAPAPVRRGLLRAGMRIPNITQ
ncbi:MAG: lycopene cyclase family protein [Chloroflexota bacterium]